MSRGIAFFDFDGTITNRDSLAEFIRFSCSSSKMITGLLRVMPHITAFKLGLADRQKSKEKLLTVFFQGIPEKEFEDIAVRFVAEKIPGMLRLEAVARLAWHLEQGHKVVIVSASPTYWIRPWSEAQGFEYISTELEVVDDKITGRIKGLNCHGEEKVKRIRNNYELSSYSAIYAYGDSSGDKPMLALSSYPYYKPFRG